MGQNPFPVELFFSFLDLLYSPMIHLVLLAIFVVATLAIMRTAPKNICLGICIPPDKYDAVPCRRMRRRFEYGVVVFAILCGGMIWISATQLSKANMDAVTFSSTQVIFFALVITWFYSVIRRAMFKLVEREGWFPVRESAKVVVDTSFHQRKKSLSPFWLLLFPLIIFVTILAYQHWRPEVYSGRFQSVFDELGFRNIKLIIFGIFPANDVIAFLKNLAFYMQIMCAAWVLFIFFACANARQSLDPTDPSGSLEEEIGRRKKIQAMQLVAYITCMIFVALIPFAICRNAIVPIFTCCIFPTYVVAVLFLLYLLSRTGATARAKSDKQKRGNRLFYYNEDDPALFLWSRTGVGFLMNIARPTVKIICGGFCLLAVGLLWHVVTYTPMTNPRWIVPPVDMATKDDHASEGANLFLDAALYKLNSFLVSYSVKGKIELIEIKSHFPSEFEIWQRSSDFQDKLRNYIDNKITLEDFGEYYTVETVREDDIIFGWPTIEFNKELQKRREQGLFDPTIPAITKDGEYLDHGGSSFEWQEAYQGFQFDTMGQLRVQAVYSLADEIFNQKGTQWDGMRYPYIEGEFREAFLRDVAIVRYYHGKDLFFLVDSEMYDGNHSAEVLEGREYCSPDKRSYSKKYRVLIDPSRGYVSPYGLFRDSRGGFEAWRASDYFRLGSQRWVPRNYTAFKFRDNVHFHNHAHKQTDEVLIVRVTIDPDTAMEERRYQEIWDEETQTRAYEEVKNEK